MSGRTLLGTDGASEPWRMMRGGGGSGRMRGVMVDVVGGGWRRIYNAVGGKG